MMAGNGGFIVRRVRMDVEDPNEEEHRQQARGSCHYRGIQRLGGYRRMG